MNGSLLVSVRIKQTLKLKIGIRSTLHTLPTWWFYIPFLAVSMITIPRLI